MRKSEITRTTRETDITVALELDGTGKSSIDTGIPFMNHMLELFAKHGLVQVQHNLKVTDAILEYPVNKISFLESDISYQQIYDALHRQFDLVPATFAPFGKESGEISEKTITKATGMKSILNYFDRSAEDAIAIGDGFNDLCMFEVAKTSVAMGNAPIEVQKKADRITTSLDNNGIYNAFIVLGLIE